MFARRVSMQLKPNSVPELTQRLEKQIIPVLRQEKGFQDEITLVATGGSYAFGISVWDTKENAEAYHAGRFVEVTKILADLVSAPPKVETFDVANSTFQKIAAAAVAAA